MTNFKAIKGILACATLALFASCGQQRSSNLVSDKTGWNYNDPQLGGFSVVQYNGQITAPGLAFVEGGRFTMGQTDEDVTYENNNTPRNVTVSSFYMDETEVANVHYREYTYWVGRTFGSDYPNLVMAAMPDTACWRHAFQYNEPLVERYFRDAAYSYYPVVGVTWNQANEYCSWRTDRVNEIILIKKGFLKKNSNQVSEDNFNTKSYLAGQYEGKVGVKIRDLDPTAGGKRPVRLEDGILIPDYRLPTEAEWEFAALALIGNNPERDSKRTRGEGVIVNRQVYPWGDNNSTREGFRNQYQGEQMANYRTSGGDMMGTMGGLNDHADIPAEIYSYKPNAYGLYNMAGNVSEWVMDVYRPETPDGDGFRNFRGNVYTKYKQLEDGTLDEKDSLGKMPTVGYNQAELADKYINYRLDNLKGLDDGDSTLDADRQSIYQNQDDGQRQRTTLISNQSRVIKGGSWNDRAFWLSPGTRRVFKETHTSSTIGFRCCMDRLGSPTLNTPSGNHFGRGARYNR
jgi:formylglycine-generating enzyme